MGSGSDGDEASGGYATDADIPVGVLENPRARKRRTGL